MKRNAKEKHRRKVDRHQNEIRRKNIVFFVTLRMRGVSVQSAKAVMARHPTNAITGRRVYPTLGTS